jgi:hypothetical protein
MAIDSYRYLERGEGITEALLLVETDGIESVRMTSRVR